MPWYRNYWLYIIHEYNDLPYSTKFMPVYTYISGIK